MFNYINEIIMTNQLGIILWYEDYKKKNYGKNNLKIWKKRDKYECMCKLK